MRVTKYVLHDLEKDVLATKNCKTSLQSLENLIFDFLSTLPDNRKQDNLAVTTSNIFSNTEQLSLQSIHPSAQKVLVF